LGAAQKDGFTLLLSPTNWSFQAYGQLLSQTRFIRALGNSLIITSVGVITNMILTTLTAYVLTLKGLPGRNLFLTMILFTFLFNVGMIPTYLLVRNLGLIDTYWAVILPTGINVYNLFVMKTFFQNLPDSLREAAIVDGASELQVLLRVVLPLSKPILLTIGMFYTVYHWNEFFQPILYFTKNDMMPLPVLLRDVLIASSLNEYIDGNAFSVAPQESLKMAAVILTTLPMLVIYPWIQRHFTKGVLIGGVKE
jgi:putative aldouronate transport system permease protein